MQRLGITDPPILEEIAARAEAIVTGDQHLLKLKRFRGIPITSPRDFLDAETRR